MAISVVQLPSLRKSKILEGSGGRDAGEGFAVLELFKGDLDGLFKLLVRAFEFLDRIIVQEDVGIYAVVLHYPLSACGVVVGEEGNTDVGAVNIGKGTAYANDAAPCARADDGAQSVSLEAPREQVSVRGGVLVDEEHLGTGVGAFRCSPGLG